MVLLRNELARLRRQIRESAVFTRSYRELSLRRAEEDRWGIYVRLIGFLPPRPPATQERQYIWPWRYQGQVTAAELEDYLAQLQREGWEILKRRRPRSRRAAAS